MADKYQPKLSEDNRKRLNQTSCIRETQRMAYFSYSRRVTSGVSDSIEQYRETFEK